MQVTTDQYVLGHDEHELRRLDEQGATLADVTEKLLRMAGVSPGMSVLDMGTGTGQVAELVARLVGRSGRVLAVDRAPAALEYARRRCAAAELPNISFAEGDVTTFSPPAQVDALVCRLVLAYQRDLRDTLVHWARCVRPGGLIVAMEYDMTAIRTLPEIALLTKVANWIDAAFTVTGQRQDVGPRLAATFTAAGLQDVGSFGGQLYLPADDPAAAAMPAAVVRTLRPALVRAGIATSAEVAIDDLEQRIRAELVRHHAVLCPPTLVAAWGRTPAS